MRDCVRQNVPFVMFSVAQTITKGTFSSVARAFLMTQVLFWSASALTALWLVVHLMIGGRQIARPLLKASELRSTVKHTQYLCWHFTTVAIAGMALFFCLAAITGVTAYATSATVLAAGFFFLGVVLIISLGENHAQLPQGWLFLPVATLGLMGHLL